MKTNLIKYLDSVLGRMLVFFLPRPVKVDRYPPRSILLIRPGGIGDAVLLVPSVSTLRIKFPDVRIDVLAERRNLKVFSLCPGIDHVYCYDRLHELYRLLFRRYDVVIDTEQWYRLTAVVARLIRSQRKIGFGTNGRCRMFTDIVSYKQECYEGESFLSLVEPLVGSVDRFGCEPYLCLPENVASAKDLLGGADAPYVVLFPGGSIAEKRWSEGFVALAKKLTAAEYRIVIVGGEEDVPLAERIVASAPGGKSMAGSLSLLQSAAILAKAALLVSGDSGVLHIAAGLGIPTVSIYGPSSVVKWAPRGKLHRVVSHELPCSPCSRFGRMPPCPIGVKCIQEVGCDEVFDVVVSLLSDISREP